jgi:hypothetical protein
MKCLFAILLFLTTGSMAQKRTTLSLFNPLAIERPDELIVFQRRDVERSLGPLKAGEFLSVRGPDGRPIAAQFDDVDGDRKWDEAVILYSLRPKEKTVLTLTVTAIDPIGHDIQRAHVRLRKKNPDESFGPSVPEETMPLRNPPTDFSKQRLPAYLTEGPAWENDKVAFRLYLDTRNNKDIYGKTTSKMMMDTVGANEKESYHELSAWGMDLLHVARSLGAGAIAVSVPRKGQVDTLTRLGGESVKKTVYRQLTDGPLLARFSLSYEWEIGQSPVRIKEVISIWGGQYFYESRVTIQGAPEGCKLITGIADFYQNSFEVLEEGRAAIAYSYGEQSENKDRLGLGVLVDKINFAGADSIHKSNTDINETYTVAQTIHKGQPLHYRFYAGWERTDMRFISLEGFRKFLRDEGQKYSAPVRVVWNQKK